MYTCYGISFDVRNAPADSKIRLFEKENEGGILKIGFSLAFDRPTSPAPITVSFCMPDIDILTTWHPLIGQNRLSRSVRPDWAPCRQDSRLSGAVPMMAMLGHTEKNSVTFAVQDVKTPMTVSAGLVEETACIRFKVVFFSMTVDAFSDYETEFYIDTRKLPYTEVIRDVETYWQKANHLTPAYIPDAARRPMYSTWYSYHQAISTEALLAECREAKKMGMDTILVDDGWQTDDNNRGYAYCGDWEITKNKIPDIHAFVKGVHDLGMKVIFWYSVPFVGKHSRAFQHFEGMFLDDPKSDFCMIDPRFPEARSFLIDKYVAAVRDWGLDGLKLDFIDSFRLTEFSKAQDPRMDIPALVDAIDRLMTDIKLALLRVNPEVLIEYRQAYIGPAMQTYGNMFRVGDCPNDSLVNRMSAIDMRLCMHSVAIHSDMLMWHYDEPVEIAARQLLNVFFTVPQISVRLNEIPADHKAMLTHYLRLWNDHRETLLAGDCLPEGVDGSYTSLRLDGKEEVFALLFGTQAFAYTGKKPLYLLNVTAKTDLYLDLSHTGKRSYHIYDCCGKCLSEGGLDTGIHKVQVPLSGMLVLE